VVEAAEAALLHGACSFVALSVPQSVALATMTVATYAWRRLDLEGVSFVRVEADDAVRIEGHEVCVDGAERWSTRFTIELDGRWRHRVTTVEATEAAGTRRLRLDDLRGCDVVDIAGNPFTNALVIRAREVPVGGLVEVRAAFVEPPALTVRPLAQRYRRLAADRWEYADDEFGVFEIAVDADGVTVDYQRLARRLG
jgi:hypothetical protein